jgi:integrase
MATERDLPKGVKAVQLADGTTRYRVRIYTGVDLDSGKDMLETHTFDTLKEAEAKAESLRVSRRGGVRVKPKKVTFSKFLRTWMKEEKEGNIKARSLFDYRGIIRRYVDEPPEGCPKIGRVQLKRLTDKSFRSYYDFLWREKGLSPRTLQYLHTILKQALNHAVASKDIASNPLQGVKPKKNKPEDPNAVTGDMVKSQKKMRAMDQEQAGKFLTEARKDRYSALWHVLLMGGLRPGEALGLLWEDVDLDEGRVHIQRALTRVGVKGWRLVEPKTDNARRTVTLPNQTIRALREWRSVQARERLQLGSEYATGHESDFVFTIEFGQPLDMGNLSSRNYRKTLEAAGLGTWEGEGDARTFKPGFRLYDLRHTCATLLLLAMEPMKVVSERLGHSSVVLTMDTYSHVLPDMQERAAEKLESMFGGA